MGYFFYGKDGYLVELDDRALAHLKVAILSLLRAGRSFELSMRRSIDVGSGRESFWINPTTEIRFHFSSSRAPRLSEAWLRAILATARTPEGLRIVEEPTDRSPTQPDPRGAALTAVRS